MDTSPKEGSRDRKRSSQSDNRPSPLDLPAFLVFASSQYEQQYVLVITVHSQTTDDEIHDKKKKASQHETASGTATTESEKSSVVEDTRDENTVQLTLIQDRHLQFVELIILRCAHIPRVFLRIIGLCLPFHPALNKIKIHWCPLQAGCFYELSKVMYQSKLTELYLDDSPVSRRQYYRLLDRASSLRVLSLARCSLDDDDVVSIVGPLVYPLPASETLSVLNLSSNRIGDSGASAIGQMLRSNRSLYYLNLSGNKVTTEGANSILNSLNEFCLTSDESRNKRRRLMQFLKEKRKIYEQYRAELILKQQENESRKNDTGCPTSKLLTRESSSIQSETPALRAFIKSAEVMGNFTDPFHCDLITVRDGLAYSMGNMALSYVNLSYNDLDAFVVPVIVDVLNHQSSVIGKTVSGLVRVCIEGNNLPVYCEEYDTINNLMTKAYPNETRVQRSQTSRRSRCKPR